ncbi:hypothetical protein AgCh_011292 [Apium graveolens]
MKVDAPLDKMWMTSIWKYIKEGTHPEDKAEARRLRYQAARYVDYEGALCRRWVIPNTKVPGHGVFGANWEGPYRIRAALWEGIYYLEDLKG